MHIAEKYQRVSNAVAAPVLALFLLGAAQAQAVKPPQPFKTLTDFETCQRNSHADETCLVALETFVRATPKEAMNAGKIARLNFNAWVSLRFFEVASRQNAKGFCQDADLQLAVLSGLALPADYPDAQRARNLFADRCFVDQTAAVVKELGGESGDSFLKRNACPILEKRQQAPAACTPATAPKPEAQAATAEKLPVVDKSAVVLGAVKVYRGPEGERITMAPIQGSELFLIRFEGVNSPWDGKVVLHKQVDRGNDAADFWTDQAAARWNSVVRRGGLMTVYVPGYKAQNGFTVRYAENLSLEANAKALLGAYQP
ncbi:MAG: hypothetical protein V4858_13200 [Pseudomonadota bacterium]